MKKLLTINTEAPIGSILLLPGTGDTVAFPPDFVGGDSVPVDLYFFRFDTETEEFVVVDLEPGEADPPTIRFSARTTAQNASTPPLFSETSWTKVAIGKYAGVLDLDEAAVAALLDALTEASIEVTAEIKVTTDEGGPISLQFPITLWKPVYTPPAP